MPPMVLTESHIEPAVRGGGILGGGGGGSVDEGRRLAREAFDFGIPQLAALEELRPDAVIVTVSLVGAPATARAISPADHLKCLREMEVRLGRPIAGVISSENGGKSTINGWLQSAAHRIPVVDAPADGRAHPTALMGAMKLDSLPGYLSLQVAAARDLFMVVEGTVSSTSKLVRAGAVEAGGFVAVCRNPIHPDYLKEHAAPGAIRLALELGDMMMKARPDQVAAVVAKRLGGEVIESGRISHVELETSGGFDRGVIRVNDLELAFWNEYMTAQRGFRRFATFPDLITTIDPETGESFTTAEAAAGRRADVVVVPRERIPLGAGVRDYVYEHS